MKYKNLIFDQILTDNILKYNILKYLNKTTRYHNVLVKHFEFGYDHIYMNTKDILHIKY